MVRRVLVTGGFGFIGNNLVKYLRDNTSDHITVIDNLSTADNDVECPADRVIYDDICDIDQYTDIEVDIIFHLAGWSKVQPSLRDPIQAIKTNTYGTAIVCELARKCKAKLVYASLRSNKYINDTSPYVVSKHMGEQIIKMYSQCYGLHAVNVRLHNVYGPGEHETGEFATVIGKFLHQYHNNKPLTAHGNINNSRDYIHVEDVCRALTLLSQHPNIMHCPTIELGSGQYYTIMDIISMIRSNPKYNLDYVISSDSEIIVCDDNVTQLSNTLIEWHPKHTLNEYISSKVYK